MLYLPQIIPPLGNTTFNVVFLGRDEGDIDTHLFIHTLDGTLKYQVREIYFDHSFNYAYVYDVLHNKMLLHLQVKGISVSSPYRLRPVDVKLPLNASFTPLIYMHNPHPETLQVCENIFIDYTKIFTYVSHFNNLCLLHK